MRRFLRIAKIIPKEKEYYIKRHADPPAGLIEALRNASIQNYTIAEKNDTLISYFEYVGQDFEQDMEKLNKNDFSKTWNEELKKCFCANDCGDFWEEFTEVFYMP